MRVLLEINNPRREISKRKLFQLARRSSRVLNLSGNYLISLALVSNRKISQLNNRYRGQKKVTDVLSFSFRDQNQKVDFFSPSVDWLDLGEIVIADTRAAKQAQEKGHSWQREIEVLFVHGLFHLLGFDHQSVVAAKKMEKLEQTVLNS